jgi:hypothetical protein
MAGTAGLGGSGGGSALIIEDIVGTKGRDRGVIGGLRSEAGGGVFALAG